MVGNVVGVLELDRDVTDPLAIAAADGRSVGFSVGLGAAAVALLVAVLAWVAWRAHLSDLKTKVTGVSIGAFGN